MLIECFAKNRPPKGLNPKRIGLKLTDLSVDTQLKWERAHLTMARTLTQILRDHWKERIDNLSNTFQELQHSLSTAAIDEELAYIHELLAKYEEEALKEINEQRKK